jgi:hypothetical protein
MVSVADLTGQWDMVHDDWTGVLTFNPSDQHVVGIAGPCQFDSWKIDGSYVQSGGTPLWVTGEFEGEDANRRTNEQCKHSPHLIRFTIAFPGPPPQPFEGYMFTHQARRMAGYTWWEGIPFGWTATKR